MAEQLAPTSGTITIEWARGPGPEDDVTAYSWSVKCDPRTPDEVVARVLGEIAEVY